MFRHQIKAFGAFAVGLGALGLMFVAAPAHAQTTPQIATVPASPSPTVPAGMKVTCMKDGSSLQPSPTCPVIQYNGFTTWAYSFIDNRVAYGVVSYDGAGKVAKTVTRNGARYVYKITVDPNAKTVSVWGQSNAKVDIAWADLPQAAAPQIAIVPANTAPTPPAGMKVTCTKDPGSATSTTCPVIQYRGYTTWAFSFLDNRVAYGIVSYDGAGKVVKNVTRNGARYVYKMTVDPNAKTVGVWGQANAKVDVAWSDLP
jgi:hypothetical protein